MMAEVSKKLLKFVGVIFTYFLCIHHIIIDPIVCVFIAAVRCLNPPTTPVEG